MNNTHIAILWNKHELEAMDACSTGNVARLQTLISLIDPKTQDSWLLRRAAYHGQAGCVCLLIPHCNPKANNSAALQAAAGNGHTDIVRLLLPHSNPKAKKNQALIVAIMQGHQDCVDLLWEHSNTQQALDFVQRHCKNMTDEQRMVWHKAQIRQQHDILTKTIRDSSQKARVRTKAKM